MTEEHGEHGHYYYAHLPEEEGYYNLPMNLTHENTGSLDQEHLLVTDSIPSSGFRQQLQFEGLYSVAGKNQSITSTAHTATSSYSGQQQQQFVGQNSAAKQDRITSIAMNVIPPGTNIVELQQQQQFVSQVPPDFQHKPVNLCAGTSNSQSNVGLPKQQFVEQIPASDQHNIISLRSNVGQQPRQPLLSTVTRSSPYPYGFAANVRYPCHLVRYPNSSIRYTAHSGNQPPNYNSQIRSTPTSSVPISADHKHAMSATMPIFVQNPIPNHSIVNIETNNSTIRNPSSAVKQLLSKSDKGPLRAVGNENNNKNTQFRRRRNFFPSCRNNCEKCFEFCHQQCVRCQAIDEIDQNQS